MSTQGHRLGRLGVQLSGSDPVRPYLDAEFSALADDGQGPRQLRFNFGPVLPLADATRLAPVRVATEAYEVQYPDLHYIVRPDESGLEVRLCSLPKPATWKRRLAPAWLRQAHNWNYLTPVEEVAKNFTYNVYDYLCQMSQLPIGQTWLHASSFERDGRGVALCAWGGIGKTSAMLKLVQEDGWRFLSDDLALIDDAGVLWRTPKKMQIYAYNTSGQPALADALLLGRGPLDRASWAWNLRRRGPSGVRRRVSAEELVGVSHVAESAMLSDILLLERADVAEFVWEPIAMELLADRVAWVLWNELQPYVDIAAAVHAAGGAGLLPRPQDQHDATVAVLRKALAGVAPRRLVIPISAGPNDLAENLRDYLNAR